MSDTKQNIAENRPAVAEPDIPDPSLQEPNIPEPAPQEPAVAEPDIPDPSLQEPDIPEPAPQDPAVAEPDIPDPSLQDPGFKLKEVIPAAEPAPAEPVSFKRGFVDAKDEEPKPKPAKEKPAPEPEVLPEKKESDLKIGFLQKYVSGLFGKGWKHNLVALSDEGRILNSWNFARDYQKKPAAGLSFVNCDGVSTYEEDKTPKKPPAQRDVANNFVVRIHGKPTYFSAESEDEANAWRAILGENKQKHFVEKVAPGPKRASKREKTAPKSEGGATADPPAEAPRYEY